MNLRQYHCILLILAFIAPVPALSLSDSLPIEGRFSQGGHAVSRHKVEKFLLTQDTCRALVNESRTFKWSGHAIGAGLWCADIAITAYQVKQTIDAIQHMNSLLDSSGKQIPFTNDINRFSVPLLIGTQIASFAQLRLYNYADYLLHKSAIAYNASVVAKYSKDTILDLRITKVYGSTYKQCGLFMTEPVLHGVLREEPASKTLSVWSLVLKEAGNQIGEWGGMYLGLAILSYILEAQGDTSLIIDRRARQTNLHVGISLTSIGVVSSIAAAVTKKVAIKKYNQTKPSREIPRPADKQSIIEEPAPPLPASAATGITAVPTKALPDSTAGTIPEGSGK
jgi:hypothetical protein